MNKKLFYIEIEAFKKKCINKLILTAIFSTLIIFLLLSNVLGCSNSIVRGLLFMGVVTIATLYFCIIYCVVEDYTDEFIKLSEKYKW